MKGVIYVETTIFSFYHDERSSPAVVAMREWTRDWWDNCRQDYELSTNPTMSGRTNTPEAALQNNRQCPRVVGPAGLSG